MGRNAARVAGFFVFAGFVGLSPLVWATHDADHRFTIDGFVCDASGAAVKKAEVVVKNTRVHVGQTVETDERGYYKATLHLHNDNVGDPVVVQAQRDEQRITIQFDPNDLESERRTRVNFGSGCVQRAPDEVPPWVLYTVGGVGVGVGGYVLSRLMRRPAVGRRQKPSRKQPR
ncbi:MAG: carboxypeptidase-like regulatory domain-containing protein [Nitrospiraceae bacterium]